MNKNIENNLERVKELLREAERNYKKFDSDSSNPNTNYLKADILEKGNHDINLANHYILRTLVEILSEKNKGKTKKENEEKAPSNYNFEKYETKMKLMEEEIYSLRDKVKGLEKDVKYVSQEIKRLEPSDSILEMC